jgi:glucan 1,3-beta-glucosidase
MLFLLLVTVITTTYAIPIQLHGLNYNTRKGPDWDWDKCKTRQEILTDLTMLSRFTTRIRLLSLTDCGQGELVLSVARELGLQLWLGLWVAPQDFVFQEEKGELIGLLERNMIDTDTVLGITVGSEAIYRNDTTVDQVIGYMNEGE